MTLAVRDFGSCPWCGSLGTPVYPPDEKAQYYNYSCGSHKRGPQPWQANTCRINELERAVDERDKTISRLEAEVATLAAALQGERDAVSELRAERQRDLDTSIMIAEHHADKIDKYETALVGWSERVAELEAAANRLAKLEQVASSAARPDWVQAVDDAAAASMVRRHSKAHDDEDARLWREHAGDLVTKHDMLTARVAELEAEQDKLSTRCVALQDRCLDVRDALNEYHLYHTQAAADRVDAVASAINNPDLLVLPESIQRQVQKAEQLLATYNEIVRCLNMTGIQQRGTVAEFAEQVALDWRAKRDEIERLRAVVDRLGGECENLAMFIRRMHAHPDSRSILSNAFDYLVRIHADGNILREAAEAAKEGK